VSLRLAAIVLLALLTAAPAAASEQSPTQAELEAELICPECATTLNQSNAPIAQRMKVFVAERIAAGDTKSEIKDKLVAQFGPGVLAAPPREGFDLIAWVLPLAGLAIGAVVLGVAIRRWTRSRATPAAVAADPSQNGAVPLEPDLERKLDEALARFE
jgi:cytochrome c-type biogenesis protein CcmH